MAFKIKDNLITYGTQPLRAVGYVHCCDCYDNGSVHTWEGADCFTHQRTRGDVSMCRSPNTTMTSGETPLQYHNYRLVVNAVEVLPQVDKYYQQLKYALPD